MSQHITISVNRETHKKLTKLMDKHKFLKSMDAVIRFLIDQYEQHYGDGGDRIEG